jgi:Heparinase II/III-like protein
VATAKSDSAATERRAFLARLRTDPCFLWRHLPALSDAAYRRIRNRVIIALSTAHRGRKRRPHWIADVAATRLPRRTEPLTAQGFPLYPPSPSAPVAVATAPQVEEEELGDPEVLFIAHRWGFLLQALLEDTIDWRGPLEACRAWIDAHTDKTERFWEPYSASERVANLCVFLAVMPEQERARQIPPSLVRFLEESLDWILSHLEYYGVTETNNHILANARALIVGGVAIENAAAIAAGTGILRRWLPQLIQSGGFLRERSSHYQLIVLNWLLDAGHFLVRQAGQRSEDAALLQGYITRMLDAAAVVCSTRGRLLAPIGDVSPDASPDQSAARLARLYPDHWPVPPTPRAVVHLKDGWFRISAAQTLVLGNFPPGHYPSGFPTHGHCDFTSFTWVHGDTAVLVDPGRYRYTADPTSLSQLSALGHSVPIVNGFAPLCESLVVNGQWWPLPYAAATLEATESDGGVLLAHSGFARATPVRRHSRLIRPRDGGLVVRDSFEGQGSVDLSWGWVFGRDFQDFDREHLLAFGERGQVKLRIDGLAGLPQAAPIFGAVPGGWISCEYGEKKPGLSVRLDAKVALPARIETYFDVRLA